MPKKYHCKKCGFEYRFKKGTFENLVPAAARELRKCPECGVKMEVKKMTPEQYQRLGKIVVGLMSGSPERSKRAYIDYHNMKREFDKSEFENVIVRLDQFRSERNMATITARIYDVRKQVVELGDVETAEFHPYDLPEKVEEIFRKIDDGFLDRLNRKETVEQLSLF